MFRQVNVPVLGVIENMSYFVCRGCGDARRDLRPRRRPRAWRAELGVPFLGEVPIDTRVREGGDEGQPIVAAPPSSPQGRVFHEIAERVLVRLKEAGRREPGGGLTVLA